MELYHATTDAEKFLCMKADLTHTPIGGTMELLPLCNMDCKMCYVRKTKAEMNAEGRMLSCDEWLRIADEAVEAGTLFLLLTGGEPLLYPEFKRLYAELARKGLILSLNTNGTLIDESWADFFAEHGCRRMNITLYGKNDDTYAKLCNNPHGFTQVMRAAELLKQRNVSFRLTCSVTPQNIDDLPELYAVAKRFEVPLQAACYMFPGGRRGIDADNQYRLLPEEAGACTLRCYQYMHPQTNMEAASRVTLSKINQPGKLKNAQGFNCRAGHSGFWMNWKGEMLPCGMFSEPKADMLKHSFQDCWKTIVEAASKLPQCSKCVDCEYQNVCLVCPAACYTETGSTDGWPEYVCRITQEMVRQMHEYLPEDEHHE